MPRSSRLSFELLETFVRVIDNEGMASVTAGQLGINLASMSKRFAQLHNVGPLIRRPWLARVGKRWQLTDEGHKVLPAAQDLVRRYDRLRDALEDAEPGTPPVTFACGQQTVSGFVCAAVAEMQKRHPEVRLRIATLRGRARIEGVVNGALDLALVSHRPEAIEQVAGRPLYIEPIFEDPLVLVAGRGVKAAWVRGFSELPEKGVSAERAAAFPLILPEPDADTRRQLERTFARPACAIGLTWSWRSVAGRRCWLTCAAALGPALSPGQRWRSPANDSCSGDWTRASSRRW